MSDESTRLFNLEAEESFLGAILLEPDTIVKASEIVTPAMLFNPRHRMIYAEMLEMAVDGKAIDIVTLGDRLKAKNNGNFPTPVSALSKLLGEVATAAGLISHAEIIAKKAQARDLVSVSRKMIDRMENGEDPTVVAGESQDTIIRLQGHHATGDRRIVESSWTAASMISSDIEKPESLLGDGLLVRGGFAALYGRPGLGKTWAVFQLALDMAAGRPWFGIETKACRVGILEMEMHAWFVQDRLNKLLPSTLTKQDHQALANIEIIAKPFYPGRIDMLDPNCRTGIATWCREKQIDVLVVDALSRVHQVDENSAMDMGRVLNAVDQIRNDTEAAVVLVHHEPKSASGNDKGGKMTPDDHLDAARGTSRIQSDTQTMMHLFRFRRQVVLAFGKVNFGPMPDNIFLDQKKGKLELSLEPSDPEVVGELNRNKVLAALELADEAGLERVELEKASGLKKTSLLKHLTALGAVKGEDGRYRLTAREGTLFERRDDDPT